MNVLITGGHGQLGWELQRTAPAGVTVAAFSSAELDIRALAQVEATVVRLAPAVIINAAAYTAVDRAEEERELAFAVNELGVGNLATVAARHGARLLQVSTDFVFAGDRSRPYRPEDPTRPLGVYGASKLAGEKRLAMLPAEQWLLLRTAWVYSSHGHNFVKTMLRLLGEKPRVGVIADQIGTPTWARGLALAIWQGIGQGLTGVHHWTDAGVASWYDFAVAIQEEALALGLLTSRIPISPLTSEEYQLPAARPPYSVLDKSSLWRALAISPDHWRVALRQMLLELKR